MTDYLDLVLVGVVCGYIGYRVSDYMHQITITDLLRRAGVTPDKLESIMADLRAEIDGVTSDAEPTDADAIEIRIEQHNDTLYAYRKDNEEFLGQGQDRVSLIERLTLKFPTGARLVLTEDDGAGLIKDPPTA